MPEGDEAVKNKRPTAVVVALVLATLGGALFLFNGGQRMLGVGSDTWEEGASQLRTEVTIYENACVDSVGGVRGDVPSDAAPTEQMMVTLANPTTTIVGTVEASAIADGCRNLPTADEWLSSAANQERLVGGAEIVIGLLAIVGAFLMRNGSIGLRRIVLGAVGLSLVLSLFVSQSSNIVTFGASLFLVVALILVYIGRGGGWFIYRTAGRAKH